MAKFPEVDEEPLTYGKTSFTVLGEMGIPDNSPSTRSVEFRLPPLSDCPTLSIQIISSAAATPIAPYAVKVGEVNDGGQTQITVEAKSIPGGPAAGQYWCSLVAVATRK